MTPSMSGSATHRPSSSALKSLLCSKESDCRPTGRLHQLAPFMDSSGLLRVGGRLRHASLDYEAKHQVILPAKGDVTRLIVTDRHKKLAHAGAEHVLTHLRQQFLVICGRAAVKRYTRVCMACRKRSGPAQSRR